MAKSSRNAQNHLICELLQNGEVLQRTVVLAKNRARVTLGAKRGMLRIPMGDIAEAKVDLLRVRKGEIQLHIPKGFLGFVKCGGEYRRIQESSFSGLLKRGDYGSINFGAYCILFKVGSPPQSPKPVRSRKFEFLASPSSLLFQSNAEVFAMVGATISALILAGGFWFGLTNRENLKPKVFAQLSDAHRIRFVSDRHFSQAPEILQEKLDRFQYLKSVASYVENMVNMFLREPMNDEDYTLISTRKMYAKAFDESQARIQSILAAQKRLADAVLKKPLQGVIHVPAVVGESLDGSLLRIGDKFDLIRKAAEENLALKKKMVKEFMDDTPYDSVTGSKGQSVARGNEAIAKINVFKQSTDEESMYLEAKKYEDIAKVYRARAISSLTFLSAEKWDPIEVPAELEGVSVGSLSSLQLSNAKLRSLTGVRVGHYEKERDKSVSMLNPVTQSVKEPLIGEIEPHLVERTVAQNRYQLQICFELALRRNQNTGGLMELKWTINSRGQVVALSLLNSSIADRQMIDCIKTKVATWRFPAPRRGSVEVRYPFEFSRG